jgi:hypothetical protein
LIFFFDYLKQQYKIELKIIKIDKKLYIQKSEIKRFLKQQHFIQIESSPLYIQALNESGKRLRGVIKQKIIAMKSSSNLSKKL